MPLVLLQVTAWEIKQLKVSHSLQLYHTGCASTHCSSRLHMSLIMACPHITGCSQGSYTEGDGAGGWPCFVKATPPYELSIASWIFWQTCGKRFVLLYNKVALTETVVGVNRQPGSPSEQGMFKVLSRPLLCLNWTQPLHTDSTWSSETRQPWRLLSSPLSLAVS